MQTRSTIVFIYLGDEPVPAGRLSVIEDTRDSHSIFTYGARYLERRDRVAVDPASLPLPEPGAPAQPFRTAEGFDIFNGIRDAAPDGWGRYVMTKAARAVPLTEFDYLVATGDHRVGALAFGPTPARPERIAPWGTTDAAGEVIDLHALAEAVHSAHDIDELDEGLRRLLTAGSSLGGARPKAATMRDGQEWIAKFPAKDDTAPFCRIELAVMRLAVRCGFEVPGLALEEAFGRDIYLIERFDRHVTGNAMKRTHFVSALTMLGAHESEATRYAYADLAAIIRQYGSQPKKDLVELYRRMVFNVLVTNDDDHLRNHGFLHGKNGWRLSPLYDVVPKPQISLNRRLVLAVGPEGRVATLENALGGAADFGIEREQAQAMIEELRRVVARHWRDEFEAAGIDAVDIERFATCFRLAEPADGET